MIHNDKDDEEFKRELIKLVEQNEGQIFNNLDKIKELQDRIEGYKEINQGLIRKNKVLMDKVRKVEV